MLILGYYSNWSFT